MLYSWLKPSITCGLSIKGYYWCGYGVYIKMFELYLYKNVKIQLGNYFCIMSIKMFACNWITETCVISSVKHIESCHNWINLYVCEFLYDVTWRLILTWHEDFQNVMQKGRAEIDLVIKLFRWQFINLMKWNCLIIKMSRDSYLVPKDRKCKLIEVLICYSPCWFTTQNNEILIKFT